MTQSLPVIFLMGPTASGKTELAFELVQQLPCQIISVDSAMIYRGMDIGTAKPSPELLKLAPHRLIDILDPSQSYSAAQFRSDAIREIDDIRRSGQVPLLVGGTMLYFRALQLGLSALPAADAEVRARLSEEGGRLGWAYLHQRLADLDPQSAQRISPNDPQRIQRALEVWEVSGRTLTDLMAEGRMAPLPYRIIKLALAPEDRAVLRKRIATRFHGMLNAGLLEEVRMLRARGDLRPEMPALRAVGYRQVWDYLDDLINYSEMVDRAIIASGQLAKRQLTWLRRETDVVWFNGSEKNINSKILNFLAPAINL